VLRHVGLFEERYRPMRGYSTGMAQRVKLATDAGPAGCGVLGDRVRLGQALANVLQNAIHASPEGGTVRVVVREEGREVIWEVSDEGPGFSAEAQGRWHEPFYSGKEGGMGLGLTVAGEVMVAHGGCVAAGPRPGGGAVVTLRMPAAKDEPEQSS
jgi:two-component system sensor histidine kinase FlrB